MRQRRRRSTASMCSALGSMNQRKLDFNRSQPLNLNTGTDNKEDLLQWSIALTFFARLLAFAAILTFLVLVLLIIFKYIADFIPERTFEEAASVEIETHPLSPEKSMSFTYGSCENDLEFGNSSSINTNISSSEDELYERTICVICYDEPRNSFFVPCGHCATCHDCAQRIFNGENKTCPVCRRFIGKVRRLFTT